jgi:hypothetical protein
MELIEEIRICAHFNCTEVFVVKNERKVFCCDNCRARQNAFDKLEETEMFRFDQNIIIANFRILKRLNFDRSYSKRTLFDLGYRMSYCSRITHVNSSEKWGSFGTRWCFNLGLKKIDWFEFILVSENL